MVVLCLRLQSTNYEGWGQRVNYPVASVVDVSDQDYLKGFTSPLTQTPFYTWGLAQRYPAGMSRFEVSFRLVWFVVVVHCLMAIAWGAS